MRSRLVEHFDPKVFHTSHIPTEFSAYAKSQTNRILKYGVNDHAPERKFFEGITIDGETSLDLDDAIWAEKTKKGYCIWIHIADVSEAIPQMSPIDREALQRTTSIYRRDHIINMIPDDLANDVLSLNQDGKKYTMTLQVDLYDEGQVYNYQIHESQFQNLNRYHYEGFAHDFQTPESSLYTQLQLLKEVSDKLRIRRIQKGGILNYGETDRRLYIGKKNIREEVSGGEKVAHDIIESLMVLANTVIGQHLVNQGVDAVFKHHYDLEERSLYKPFGGIHTGLAVSNYTHFTSPIRRYVDIVTHRILKTLLRKEEHPFHISDLSFIANHTNFTRTKVELLGSQVDFEYKGENFIKRHEARLGRPLLASDMKVFIKNGIKQRKKMPKCIKSEIIRSIEEGNSNHWSWLVGVILFSRDNDLKQYMRNKIMAPEFMGGGRILNILADTQLLPGEDKLFTILESNDIKKIGEDFYVTIQLHGETIVEYAEKITEEFSYESTKGKVRKVAVDMLFDYFIDN